MVDDDNDIDPYTGNIELPKEQLRQLIDRIERLEKEKSDITSGISDVYAEARSQGFDPKLMRDIIKLRRKDQEELDNEEAVLHMYKVALGMKV
ncbi:MAG: DUF2312 domain-containing protein [Magnetococcales bacterium]|nr:DUF2312 domain-containing protein [Magnetococcales bacterium]